MNAWAMTNRIWAAIKHMIQRRLRPRELLPLDAIAIHDIIMKTGEEPLVSQFKGRMKASADCRMGVYALALVWHGEPLPEAVFNQILKKYSVKDLYNRNLLSHEGRYIELGVLANRLPDDIVMEYFHFDMEAVASREGLTIDGVRTLLQRYYQGQTINQWGEQEVHFRKVGSEELDNLAKLTRSLGFGGISSRGGDTYFCEGRLGVENVNKLRIEEDDGLHVGVEA